MKKVIIIGATSGIGKELAKVFSKKNYIVGLVGRRVELLKQLKKQLPSKSYIKKIDISKAEQAMRLLTQLIKDMSGMDLIIISSAVSYTNPDLDWNQEKETIETNILGFLAMTNIAVKYFSKKGKGHIIGVSSIAALRSSSSSTAYCASKIFVSNYLKGLREKLKKKSLKIYVTEIMPGFVDTPMMTGKRKMFWVSSPQKAARQIYAAIKNKKEHAYISRRWRIIAWILHFIPHKVKSKL